MAVPVEDDVAAIRSVLWRETDCHFKQALEQYTKVKTNVEVKVGRGDFTREEPHQAIEKVTPIHADRPCPLVRDKPLSTI